MQEQSLFIAALEKEDAVERAAFLDQACAGDPELRQRLDRLLEQHRRAGGFLETPAVPCVAAAIEALAGSGDTEPPEGEPDDQALDFLVPSDQPDSLGRLGHYEVLEVIGRGGMGIVLRAFDEKLHRVVAIKVMAPALAANATARKRFLREAQAAAAVRHDHVVDHPRRRRSQRAALPGDGVHPRPVAAGAARPGRAAGADGDSAHRHADGRGPGRRPRSRA